MRAARRGERDERGAVAIVAALMTVVILTAAAFVLDIGQERVGRADMQALADVVALDLSRELDGRTADQLGSVMPGLAAKSRDRNLDNVGATPTLKVDLGQIKADNTFQVVTGSTRVTAVRVTATTTVAFAIGTSLTSDDGPGSGTVSRKAVAASTSFACYKLGSWYGLTSAAGVLINPTLRQMAQQSGAFTDGGAVQNVDYLSLASAKVRLTTLAQQVGQASVSTMAKAQINLKTLLTGMKNSLNPASSNASTILTTLSNVAKSTVNVDMSKLLAVDDGSVTLLESSANVLDLVGTAISMVDNTDAGSNFTYVYLGNSLGSVSSANFKVRLGDGPRQYCGAASSTPLRTESITAQVGGQLNPVTIDGFDPSVTNLLTNVTSANITAQNYTTFDLVADASSSTLTSLSCGSSGGATVSVSRGGATVKVGETEMRSEVKGTLKNPNGTNQTISNVLIRANGRVAWTLTISNAGTSSVTVSGSDTPVSSGGTVMTISPVTIGGGYNVTANANGGSGGDIALSSSDKQKIIESIFNKGVQTLMSPSDSRSIATTVIEPMMALAGLSVNGAKVTLDSTPALACATPKLVG